MCKTFKDKKKFRNNLQLFMKNILFLNYSLKQINERNSRLEQIHTNTSGIKFFIESIHPINQHYELKRLIFPSRASNIYSFNSTKLWLKKNIASCMHFGKRHSLIIIFVASCSFWYSVFIRAETFSIHDFEN